MRYCPCLFLVTLTKTGRVILCTSICSQAINDILFQNKSYIFYYILKLTIYRTLVIYPLTRKQIYIKCNKCYQYFNY